MTLFLSVLVPQCVVATDGSYTRGFTAGFTGGYNTLGPYILYVGHFVFQTSSNASDIRNLFMRLGLAVLQKHLMDDYRQMLLWDGFVLRV